MRHSLYFLHWSQKHQNFSRWFFAVNVDDGLEYLEKIVFRWFFEIVYSHLVQSTCNVYRFNLELPGLLFVVLIDGEEGNECIIIDSRWSDDQFKVISTLHDAFEEAEQ